MTPPFDYAAANRLINSAFNVANCDDGASEIIRMYEAASEGDRAVLFMTIAYRLAGMERTLRHRRTA